MGDAHGSQAHSRLSQKWWAPEGARCRSSSALLSASATTLSRNSSIPCGALPSILACCPGMVTSQPSRPPHSYANSSTKYKYYELAVASRQIAREGRSRPALPRKGRFPYECLLKRAITRHCMHVHAVLSSFKANKLSTTEERMTRWLHRLDVEAAL